MSFVLSLGFSHHQLDLDVLERLAISAEKQPKAYSDILGRTAISEVVILSTCERIEIFACVDRFHSALGELRSFLSEFSGVPEEFFADTGHVHFEDGAVRHLFAISCGLESSVLGEIEILGQVRRSWDLAKSEGATGAALDALFGSALQVGRLVRTQTSISRGTTSLSQAAVQLAGSTLPNGLAGRKALVVGAGEMGEGVVRALHSVEGIAGVYVANRSHQRAEELSSKMSSTVSTLDLRDATECLVSEVDVLVSTVSSRLEFASPEAFVRLIDSRGGKTLLVVDLALPRSIDPEVRDVFGVELVDLEQLTEFAELSHKDRAGEISKVEDFIDEAVEKFFRGLSEREVSPLVGSLYERAEAIRVAELERFSRKVIDLDEEHQNTIEALTKGIVAKLLHEPVQQLKERSGTSQGQRMATELRKAFDL